MCVYHVLTLPVAPEAFAAFAAFASGAAGAAVTVQNQVMVQDLVQDLEQVLL